MSYFLDPGYDHSRPHITYDFEERDRANFIKIMYTRLLGEEGHKPVLPPWRDMMVPPHDLGELEHICSRLWAPIFHLCGR